jgi:hypothetical protein
MDIKFPKIEEDKGNVESNSVFGKSFRKAPRVLNCKLYFGPDPNKRMLLLLLCRLQIDKLLELGFVHPESL